MADRRDRPTPRPSPFLRPALDAVMSELPPGCPDDGWNYMPVIQLGRLEPRWIRMTCRHERVVDVIEHLTGDVVAHLCLTCDGQLP